jgi:hypothetical protein
LINEDAHTTIREERESSLIGLTSAAHETALQPLDETTSDAVRYLARETLQIAGQPVH